MFITVILFLFFIMGAAMVMLIVINRNPGMAKSAPKQVHVNRKKKDQETFRHISELIDIQRIEGGILYAGGKYLGLARIEGTNFSVLSDGEQDVREDVLIGIQNQIPYPIQYITSTVITDTEMAAGEIHERAMKTQNMKLANYMNRYAAKLQEMKTKRQAMAKVTWLVISDDGTKNPAQQICKKMAILQEAFRARAGIILTPLLNNADIIDTIQQIMLPEKLSKPSEMVTLGAEAPFKINIKEMVNLSA